MSTFDVRDMMKLDSGAETFSSASSTTAPAAPRGLNPLAEHVAAMPVGNTLSAIMIEGVTRFLDAAIIALTGFALFQIYLSDVVDYHLPYWIIVPTIVVTAQIVFQALHLYQLGALRSFTAQFFRVIAGWSIIFLLGLALLFFMKSGDLISRVWFGSYFLAGLAGLLFARGSITLFVKRMTRMGRLERRTALVGGGESGEELIRALEAQHDTGLRICGVFDDRNDDRSPDLVGGYPKLGTVDDLVEFARRTRLDLVIFTMPISAETRLLQMLRKLWVLPIDIRLAAHMSKLRWMCLTGRSPTGTWC
jgi:FlaA1/EpsC-like NDP-sugar epimerase